MIVSVNGCLGGGGGTTTSEQPSGGSQTTSQGGTSSGGYGTTESPGGTGTGTSTGTTTETETGTGEYASWADPWDAYNPVDIDDQQYMITYVKYKLRVRTEEGSQIYEYEVEKRRGPTKIHVYGNQINMETGEQEKVDLGEFDVYEYYGKIIPINSENMTDTFEYRLWVKERTEDTDTFFLFPSLDFLTLYASLYGGAGDTVGSG
ncbi:hypothetical protein [Thermococcus pacificus]|uniref:hypothetical protein n=1 Tax=Thermococcus pacificus TaxID=71998 RepID=UPI001E648FC9|nr:hypothetical protein [Thermococcus pacificus]